MQRAVNRIQTEAETLEVIAACRDNGFRSVNVDLIYGLPRQTRDGFARTLDRIVEVRPDRLAVYSYAHLPELFKAQRQIDESALPAPEDKLALLALAIERLTAAGYVYIGMDHFALPGDDLARAQDRGDLHRNFMGYTTHANCDLVGLGVSSISHIGATYSQNPREAAGLGERDRRRPAAGLARPAAGRRRSPPCRRHPAPDLPGRGRHARRGGPPWH